MIQSRNCDIRPYTLRHNLMVQHYYVHQLHNIIQPHYPTLQNDVLSSNKQLYDTIRIRSMLMLLLDVIQLSSPT